MERIRDFHDYALYKFTFTFTLHRNLLTFPYGIYNGDHDSRQYSVNI